MTASRHGTPQLRLLVSVCLGGGHDDSSAVQIVPGGDALYRDHSLQEDTGFSFLLFFDALILLWLDEKASSTHDIAIT